MKLAVLACALCACIHVYQPNATSTESLRPGDDRIELAMPVRDAAQLVIEKLGARGFTVVDAKPTPIGYYVKLAGNRDFSGAMTLGSVFYVWLESVGDATRVRMLGKPTLDHLEGCPTVDLSSACTDSVMLSRWGITGAEEAQVIHGTLAEMRLDGSTVSTATADTHATNTAPGEPGHLTLHGCGRP